MSKTLQPRSPRASAPSIRDGGDSDAEQAESSRLGYRPCRRGICVRDGYGLVIEREHPCLASLETYADFIRCHDELCEELVATFCFQRNFGVISRRHA
jgi:hypothetical protein